MSCKAESGRDENRAMKESSWVIEGCDGGDENDDDSVCGGDALV